MTGIKVPRPLIAVCWVLTLPLMAQHPEPDILGSGRQDMVAPTMEPEEHQDALRSTYVLGEDDEIKVSVLEAEEISADPLRIDARGGVNLPLVGRLRAGGLTLAQVELEITRRLKTYIRDPHVVVTIAKFRSQTASVIGAVHKPGLHALRGSKTLVEVLSLAGGLRPDAGYAVTITRPLRSGRIPLATAHDDSTGGFSVAEVNLKEILQARAPHQNIAIRPHDVVSVPRADMVYVVGAVGRSGGFPLQERQDISVVEALALAGGMIGLAAPKNARILRRSAEGGERTEIAVNLKKVIEGRSRDVPLQRDDILFVPKSGGKIAAKTAAETALRIGTGIAIFSSR